MKILADECIPPNTFRLLARLLKLLKPPVDAVHLLDRLKAAGVPDDHWVPQIGQEGGWLVITGDCGRGKPPRLPELLPAHNVTGVFMGGNLPQECAFVKFRAIMVNYPKIVAAAAGPAGKRYIIHRQGPDGFSFKPW